MNGGVIFGKTTTAEFAVHHLPAEKTRNPENIEHTPGTSSSGSAAAVSAKMVPIALGTQTAASIIRPASYTGTVGFKPSFGLIPRTGILKTADSLDSVGFFSNYIEDCKLIFKTTHIKGKDYPYAQRYLNPEFSLDFNKNKIKIGIISSGLWVFQDYAIEIMDQFHSFIDSLNKDIYEVNEIHIPHSWNNIHNVHQTIYDCSLSYYFKKEFSKSLNKISQDIIGIIERGMLIGKEQYHYALKDQNKHAKEIKHIFSEYDFIATPSTASTAPLIGDNDIPDSNLIWTLAGIPCINLPLFKGANNMPFGLLILANKYKDYELLEYCSHLYKQYA